jgi:hypothetical protein
MDQQYKFNKNFLQIMSEKWIINMLIILKMLQAMLINLLINKLELLKIIMYFKHCLVKK